jgi:hypothetical protein
MACVLFAVGCSGTDGSGGGEGTASVDSAPAAVTSPASAATVPDGTAEPEPTAGSSTSVVPLVRELPAAPCELGAVAPEGEVTLVVGSTLYGVHPDGTAARCLAQLPSGRTGAIEWGPLGDRVLLGPGTVLDATGERASGFFVDNPGVRWSRPTGSALIAPRQDDGHLIWRRSTDAEDRLDISFLARTDAAVYHPAGKNILGVGSGPDGLYGVYLAGNRGEDPRPVATIADPTTVVHDLAFDAAGTHAYFVHDHPGEFHVHDLTFPDLALTDLAVSSEPVGRLVVDDTSSIAWREGDCRGRTTTVVWSPDARTSRPVGAGFDLEAMSTEPVGWVGDARLAVMARARGCEGPGDLWISPTDGGPPVLLAAAIEQAAVRTVAPPAPDLPGGISNQAPG